MNKPRTPIKWAPRVSQKQIRRLYETDARGIVDEDLINDVGISLLARCESIRRVTEQCCPECGDRLNDPGPWDDRRRVLRCTVCGWKGSWHHYNRSHSGGQRLNGGRGYSAFLAYLREYPACRSPQQKILCIDRLVDAIHQSVNVADNLPAAHNVIGGTQSQIRDLLDSLAYGDDARRERPGIRAEYEEKMGASDSARAERGIRERKGSPGDSTGRT